MGVLQDYTGNFDVIYFAVRQNPVMPVANPNLTGQNLALYLQRKGTREIVFVDVPLSGDLATPAGTLLSVDGQYTAPYLADHWKRRIFTSITVYNSEDLQPVAYFTMDQQNYVTQIAQSWSQELGFTVLPSQLDLYEVGTGENAVKITIRKGGGFILTEQGNLDGSYKINFRTKSNLSVPNNSSYLIQSSDPPFWKEQLDVYWLGIADGKHYHVEISRRFWSLENDGSTKYDQFQEVLKGTADAKGVWILENFIIKLFQIPENGVYEWAVMVDRNPFTMMNINCNQYELTISKGLLGIGAVFANFCERINVNWSATVPLFIETSWHDPSGIPTFDMRENGLSLLYQTNQTPPGVGETYGMSVDLDYSIYITP